MSGTPGATCYLVTGDDPAVTAQRLRELLGEVVGEGQAALTVEEHGGPGADGVDIGAIVDAVTTPPFLGDRRVVVVRDAGRLSAGEGQRLLDALERAAPTSVLVVAAGGGTIPAPLAKALRSRGQVVDASVGRGRDRSRWFADQVSKGPVRLNASATSVLEHHLGDDLGRLDGILDQLAAGYGEGAQVGEEDLAPFLGEAGAVPPWELTDAVDRGETEAALAALGRMAGAGGRSAPEIVAVLHRHFDQLLRLDGTEVTSPEEAAAVLGVRSSYVAKKALGQSRFLGTERVGQAVALLSRADLDIKGQSLLPSGAVLEVLVARLSRLAPARHRRH